jgi:hypothetical protein
VEGTVKFEREYFEKQIENGAFDPKPAQDWLNHSSLALRVDQELTNRMSLKTWRQLRRQLSIGSTAESIADSGIASTMSMNSYPDKESTRETFLKALSRSILPSMDVEGLPKTFCFDVDKLRDMQSEIRAALRFRICLILVFKINEKFPDICTKSTVSLSQLKDSISALLANNGQDGMRWEECVDDIALEIFRQVTGTSWSSPNYFFREILEVQEFLREKSKVQSEFFLSVERVYGTALTAKVLDLAGVYPRTFENGAHTAATHDIADIAQRLVDVGTLHWAIFSDLVYTALEDENNGQGSAASSPEVMDTA